MEVRTVAAGVVGGVHVLSSLAYRTLTAGNSARVDRGEECSQLGAEILVPSTGSQPYSLSSLPTD